MSFFNRLFKVVQSEAHSTIEKFENPIKLTEQGIRDLKKDLEEAMKSLAEVKAISIKMQRDIDSNKKTAADYEKKAMLLLGKTKDGSMDLVEAERLATLSLEKKEECAKNVITFTTQKKNNDQMVLKLEETVSKLKKQITKYENELTTLKARYKTAVAAKKLNKQISSLDSSSTIAMLEKMKDKVEENEVLAESYGDMADSEKSFDEEINSALNGSGSVSANQSLEALKKKMGLK
jgi:phage shock protein A